jgi:hypothetical protein
MFDPVARHLTNPDTAEDRMQEALSLVFEMYQDRIINRDLVLDDAILVHAAKQRACDLSRHLVRDGKCKVHDAMSERAYHAGHVEVVRLDAWTEDDEEDEGHPNQIGLAEELCQSPEHKLNSALDLEEWLHGLTARDYGIMEGRMAGFSLPRIATDLGVSTSAVFARAKKLGLELASRAGVHVDLDKTRSGRIRQRRAMCDAE